MTVVATIISKDCTVHACDSLVTIKSESGKRKVIEQEKSKIVCVRHYRGAIVCWGLGKIGDKWTTDWLRGEVSQANKSGDPEEFAHHIRDRLNIELSQMRFQKKLDAGIGIHFTAYEYIDGFYIPELFQITNFKDPSAPSTARYQELFHDGVQVRRETYENYVNKINKKQGKPPRHEHGLPSCRHKLREFLDKDGILIFNNGDTMMFNAAISGILNMFEVAQARGALRLPEGPETFRKIALWPIDQVCKMQKSFVKESYRLVGGKRHNISVAPDGSYDSDTGEKC